ncbi:unnamed protein product [Urochloa humidicola]
MVSGIQWHPSPSPSNMGADGWTAVEERMKKQEPVFPVSIIGGYVQRSPAEKPPFTLVDIKKAIPAHCFQRSVIKSFSYLVHDLVIAAGLFYFALVSIPAIPTGMPRYIAWLFYWAAQGSVLTGVWVIGHECGHHAFSDYLLLDNIVGFVLHSALLTPFFSWKYSHRRHHANTGSMENDEVYVAKKKSALPWYTPYVFGNPVGRLVYIVLQLTLAWPLYLAFNLSGQPYPRFTCHYDPYSPLYSDRERIPVLISDAGIVAVLLTLYKFTVSYGFWLVVRVYGMPVLIVSALFVLITYLHHTHLALPHYDSSEWDWLRGALATMDRDYGILNRVLHNVTDTHVLHHIFPNMPHYHAMEATKAMRPVLGEYYRRDSTPILKATFHEAKECIYVEQGDRKGIYWYSNKF